MHANLDKFESGWVGITLSFGAEEIDLLIERLRALKDGKLGHFHFRTDDFSKAHGITDIEISMKGEDDEDNMSVG